MRIGNVGNARSLYYDRNPQEVAFRYLQTNVPPYAGSGAGFYQVPVNRKAFLEFLTAQFYRATQFFPPGLVQILITYTNAQAIVTSLADVVAMDGRINVLHGVNSPLQAELVAGDSITALVSDNSGGGSVSFDIGVKIIEFDA